MSRRCRAASARFAAVRCAAALCTNTSIQTRYPPVALHTLLGALWRLLPVQPSVGSASNEATAPCAPLAFAQRRCPPQSLRALSTAPGTHRAAAPAPLAAQTTPLATRTHPHSRPSACQGASSRTRGLTSPPAAQRQQAAKSAAAALERRASARRLSQPTDGQNDSERQQAAACRPPPLGSSPPASVSSSERRRSPGRAVARDAARRRRRHGDGGRGAAARRAWPAS